MKKLEFVKGKVLVQSMLDFKTSKVKRAIRKINELERLGCDLIRVSVKDLKDALSLKKIVSGINIPLVADIHYDYRLALVALDSGVSKIRINPSNIPLNHLKEIILKAKEKDAYIRIGVNSGSIKKRDKSLEELMIMELEKSLQVFKELDFSKIVVSLKSSDIETSLKVAKLYHEKYDYPFHAGLTEAGLMESGLVRSTIFLTRLFDFMVPETIRYSLTTDPKFEVLAALNFLKSYGLRHGLKLIACPTCGRKEYDVIKLAKSVEKFLVSFPETSLRISVMGCVVNGIGEAKDSDYGIVKVKHEALLFKKSDILCKGSLKKVMSVLKEEITKTL